MKKAFTLVELLVVIGIIGILSAILLVSMGAGTESARAAKCLGNMKSLWNAVGSYTMARGWYPLAGSIQYRGYDESRGMSNRQKVVNEKPGWISWDSRGKFPNTGESGCSVISAYEQDYDTREYALTNGALWKYVSGKRDVFVCPVHEKAMSKKSRDLKPLFSYVMSEYFGWDSSHGSRSRADCWYKIEHTHLSRADRRVMFAELNWTEGATSETPQFSTGSESKLDCTLAHSDNECIGFNHKDGKDYLAHVIFADGHIEKLRMPKRGISQNELHNLTEWLCEGKDVSFDGKKYEQLKN